MSGKVISLYSLNQCMDIVRFNYKIIRNEAFEYEINSPNEQPKKI